LDFSDILPAAKQHQPGIINNGMETVSLGFNDYRCSGCIGEKCRTILIVYGKCSDAALMPDKNPLLSGLENQDVTMQDPDIFHSELHYMPGPSSDINMQQFVFPG
jgi:hypothetical protein